VQITWLPVTWLELPQRHCINHGAQRVADVRRWLRNYQKLKEAIEAICELNHDLLRPQRAASKRRSKQHD
jgi:hypothetical protein